MAKFTFPLTIAQLEQMLSPKGKAELGQLLGGEHNDVEFAFTVLKNGWTNMQYRKDKQMKDRETLARFKELERKDPERMRQLLSASASQTDKK